MSNDIHGTKRDSKRSHPVFDLAKWNAKFPLGDVRSECFWIQSPERLAHREQALQLAATKGQLGPSLPADIFVWSRTIDHKKPWLTRIGGAPWRKSDKPWPKDPDGIPLHFLGQICFADSRDILPCELPGDVALIFGRWQGGWASTLEVGVLEWSPLKLKNPATTCDGWTSQLPFRYQGIIHRSVQLLDDPKTEAAFLASGWKQGGFRVSSIQATCVSQYASLPQGWPFQPGDGNTLIATLSSFYFTDPWPLCDVPRGLSTVDSQGNEHAQFLHQNALSLGILDAGCTWIYRDKHGDFPLAIAC